jgi:monoamine oxidase
MERPHIDSIPEETRQYVEAVQSSETIESAQENLPENENLTSEAAANAKENTNSENSDNTESDTVLVRAEKLGEIESINDEANDEIQNVKFETTQAEVQNEPENQTLNEEAEKDSSQNYIRINQVVVSEDNEIEINQSQITVAESDPNLYDVIIVGAGIAGASAAYHLKKTCSKLRILVIEAKNRVGGRTQTVDLKCSEDGTKSKWDVGGQWVTDTQTNITRILNELEIETYKQYDSGRKVLEANGKLITYNSSIPKVSLLSLLDLQLMMMKISSTAKKINTLNPFENAQFATSLDLTNLDQYMVSKAFGSATSRSIIDPAIRVIFGTEMSQLNSLYGAMYVKSGGGSIENLALTDKGCSQEKRVKGGTQQISEKLLAKSGLLNDTDLLLNTALVEVKQNAGEKNTIVELTTKNAQTGEVLNLKAKRVISSMPINQYIHVNFSPELPAHKRHVFENCQMGNLIKFVVTYKTTFWRSYGFSGEVVTDGSVIWTNEKVFKKNGKFENLEAPTLGPISCIFDGTNSEGYPALVGFIGGRGSLEWTGKSSQIFF